MPKQIKILSIDGGGIRGIIPTIFLDQIEQQTGRPISSLFDLITGTSAGGIITLGLTIPDLNNQPKYTAQKLLDIFDKENRQVFQTNPFRKILTLGSLINEKYSNQGLQQLLDQYLGHAKLTDCLTQVLLTSYDIEDRSPFFFKSTHAHKDTKNNFLLKHAALATTAAPTFFEPAKIPYQNSRGYLSLIDGGVFAANPSLTALVEATKIFPDADEYILVSLGTGKRTQPILHKKAKRWGLIGWAPNILSVVFDGIDDVTDYYIKKLQPETETLQNYYRLQVNLTKCSDRLDNISAKNIKSLKNTAHTFIKNNQALFKTLSKQLVGNSRK